MRRADRYGPMPSRRDALKAGLKVGAGLAGATTLSGIAPVTLHAQRNARAVLPEHTPLGDPAAVKALLLRGLDAATADGANYAEARWTHTVNRSVGGGGVLDSEEIHVGVRALVNGYWGFAAGPVGNSAELARLGRSATMQARTNALGKVREIDLAPVTVVRDGRWVMPVKTDPFTVHPLAVLDYLIGLRSQIIFEAELGRDEQLGVDIGVEFRVQEQALATTQGTYVTQRLYRTGGAVGIGVYRPHTDGMREERRSVDLLTPAGVGWEMFRDQPVRETALQLILDARTDLDLPSKPVDVGRFDVVMDATSVANMLSQSIGAASELDRALGYEANADGTSFLDDPLAMIDTLAVGSSLLTVTANRSDAGALATVQWDDEGVTPVPFAVIEGGVLRNYHYTREGAGWLRASGVQRPFRSLGVACAPTAVDAPLPHTANLVLAPAGGDANYRSMIAGMAKGIAVREANPSMDFQRRSGLLFGQMYEIKDGKRVARLIESGILFQTIELWKSLIALGGVPSTQRFGLMAVKGEPAQQAYHSVTAVPATFKELTIVDLQRRG